MNVLSFNIIFQYFAALILDVIWRVNLEGGTSLEKWQGSTPVDYEIDDKLHLYYSLSLRLYSPLDIGRLFSF
jgi:hypothetical protein